MHIYISISKSMWEKEIFFKTTNLYLFIIYEAHFGQIEATNWKLINYGKSAEFYLFVVVVLLVCVFEIT